MTDPFAQTPKIVNKTELKLAKSNGGTSEDNIHEYGVPPMLSTKSVISSQ